MKANQIVQISIALVATITPFMVVLVARTIALKHAQAVQAPFTAPRIISWLGWTTAAILPLVLLIALLLPAPSFTMGLIDLAVFALLAIVGLFALQRIDQASKSARQLTSDIREASLRPRRIRNYLPFAWRLGLFVAAVTGLALFVKRLTVPVAGRQLLVPVAFASAAAVFLWLYETWIKSLVQDGRIADPGSEARLHRLVRKVFAVEVLLVVTFLGLAHALLNSNWATDITWAAAATVGGAFLGLLGCALAVSSNLLQRRYAVTPGQKNLEH